MVWIWEGISFVSLIFIPLQIFGGGLHMKTYIGCLVCSCLMVGGVLISSGIVAGKYEYMVGRDQWNTCVYSCKYYGTCTTYKSPDEEARNYHMQKKSENVYCYLGCSTTVSKWLQ